MRAAHAAIEDRLATLTPRELDVLELVVAGRLNKQIGAALGTAEKTVKVHRARMMRKMQVDSLADLVRLWTVTRPPITG
jgi:FixJ family two-component response regulator